MKKEFQVNYLFYTIIIEVFNCYQLIISQYLILSMRCVSIIEQMEAHQSDSFGKNLFYTFDFSS